MTLLGIARAEKIPIQDLEVRLSPKTNFVPKIHARYHEDPERRRIRIAKIKMDIHVRGTIAEAQVEILKEAARNYCPLHNTLAAKPEIEENIYVNE